MGKIDIFHLGTEDGGIGEILNCLHCNLALLNTMGQDRCVPCFVKIFDRTSATYVNLSLVKI